MNLRYASELRVRIFEQGVWTVDKFFSEKIDSSTASILAGSGDEYRKVYPPFTTEQGTLPTAVPFIYSETVPRLQFTEPLDEEKTE